MRQFRMDVIISDEIANIALSPDIFAKVHDYHIIEGAFNFCHLSLRQFAFVHILDRASHSNFIEMFNTRYPANRSNLQLKLTKKVSTSIYICLLRF